MLPEEDTGGLEEIVVTAQKREQSLQDVPIAVTAISQASLETNRIVSVADLNGIAPNVSVRPAAGGTQIASFTVRGVNSYGVVPGSDKQVSINLDGVYISSARGSIFDIADIARIEVLRGPQGTLFGRNATAGAVSIITRDPKGEFGGTLSGTIGNYDQRRLRATIELPQVGPFSAYVTYQHNERRGDTVNTAAGIVWDKTGPDGLGKQVSPKTLGDSNAESVFAALKFEPSDNFNMVYKYDWAANDYTPEANTAIVINPEHRQWPHPQPGHEQPGRRRCHDRGIHRPDHPAGRGSRLCPGWPAHRFCHQRLDRSRQAALHRPQPDRELARVGQFLGQGHFRLSQFLPLRRERTCRHERHGHHARRRRGHSGRYVRASQRGEQDGLRCRCRQSPA